MPQLVEGVLTSCCPLQSTAILCPDWSLCRHSATVVHSYASSSHRAEHRFTELIECRAGRTEKNRAEQSRHANSAIRYALLWNTCCNVRHWFLFDSFNKLSLSTFSSAVTAVHNKTHVGLKIRFAKNYWYLFFLANNYFHNSWIEINSIIS